MNSKIRRINTSFKLCSVAQILKVTPHLNGYVTTFSMNLPYFRTNLKQSVLCLQLLSLLGLITVGLPKQFRVILTAISSPKSSVTLRSMWNFTRKPISWKWWAWQISVKLSSILPFWCNPTNSVCSFGTQRGFSFWPILTRLLCLDQPKMMNWLCSIQGT